MIYLQARTLQLSRFLTKTKVHAILRSVNSDMQLSEAIKSFCVGHMYPSKLKQVLKNEHPTVNIVKVQAGMILMNQGITIKCITDYYENPTGSNYKTNNLIARCRRIREDYNVLCSDLDCRLCHLQCLEAVENHELKRKQKKRRR